MGQDWIRKDWERIGLGRIGTGLKEFIEDSEWQKGIPGYIKDGIHINVIGISECAVNECCD